jgi:hypothetical protein
MSDKMKLRFKIAAKPKLNLMFISSTDEIKKAYLAKRGTVEGRTQFPLGDDRVEWNEHSYFITHKKDPISFLRVRKEEVDGEKILTLLVAESKTHSVLKGHVLDAVLDCVEKMAKDEKFDTIVMDRPNYRAPHMKTLFEKRGYKELEPSRHPRKIL